MVYARDSKSRSRKGLRVQVPPMAPFVALILMASQPMYGDPARQATMRLEVYELEEYDRTLSLPSHDARISL